MRSAGGKGVKKVRLPRKYFILAAFGGVLIIYVSFWNYKSDHSTPTTYRRIESQGSVDEKVRQEMRTESGQFRIHTLASRLAAPTPVKDANSPSLAVKYSRRAYNGAPPVIPHPIKNDDSKPGAQCLSCHLGGGYVDAFHAYAPKTPHPDYINCRQCHVPAGHLAPFRGESNFATRTIPKQPGAALPGGPPRIPHDLKERGNCAACHVGEGVPLAIRTSHPERIYCRQCHVPQDEENQHWERSDVTQIQSTPEKEHL